ncbi:MAG: class B sortase [Oscillospiraceae bacterium]|nr:class B sortase [Oscillospiraceae bacterium]
MANNNEFSHNGSQKNGSKLTVILLVIVGVLLIAVVAMMLILLLPGEEVPETTPTTPTDAPIDPSTEPPTDAPTDPPKEMMESMAELYAQNDDIVGWIKIEGTKIDYPVMHTPDEEDKYIHLSFEGKYSFGGVPYIKEECSLDPESDNLIFYGHNMNNGTMFQNLMNYKKENYWKEHPTISFTTLYEERTYEILAVLEDRIYSNDEDVFKFYDFIDAEDEAEYNEAIQYFKDNALYDTGVDAEYGDQLITLVTCAYHVKNGRMVVVAREVTADDTTATAE